VNNSNGWTRVRAAWPLALGAVIALGAAIAPAAPAASNARAVATTSVFVSPATTTVAPAGSTGGTFTVHVSANSAVDLSGAGAGLTFDHTKLQLTAVAKTVVPVDPGTPAVYAGFPSPGQLAAFLSNANTTGSIPAIAWSYTDGSSFQPAGVDQGIFAATFTVTAAGDSALTPVIDAFGGLIDGRVATYGAPVTIDSILAGNVVNPAAAVPPKVSLTTPSTIQGGTSMTVAWAGTPGSAAVQNFDVRYRKASYKSTSFSAYTTWQTATTALSASLALSAGYTYCFSVLARDVNGLTSSWTADKCTISPLDDRSLTKSGTWSALSSTKYYRGTYRQSKTLNASLSATSVKYKKLYLVASTCTTCGSVKVYLGSTLLKTISLKGATAYKKAFLIYSGTAVKSGTLKVKVSVSGKYDRIDGLAIGMY